MQPGEALGYAGAAVVLALPAVLFSAILTPLAGRLASRMGLVAPVRPDRLHRKPRPYGGGAAVLLASALAVALLWAVVPTVEDEAVGFHAPWLPRVAMGATLFFLLGLLDDRFAFGAWLKLVLQLACAAVVDRWPTSHITVA